MAPDSCVLDTLQKEGLQQNMITVKDMCRYRLSYDYLVITHKCNKKSMLTTCLSFQLYPQPCSVRSACTHPHTHTFVLHSVHSVIDEILTSIYIYTYATRSHMYINTVTHMLLVLAWFCTTYTIMREMSSLLMEGKSRLAFSVSFRCM